MDERRKDELGIAAEFNPAAGFYRNTRSRIPP